MQAPEQSGACGVYGGIMDGVRLLSVAGIRRFGRILYRVWGEGYGGSESEIPPEGRRPLRFFVSDMRSLARTQPNAERVAIPFQGQEETIMPRSSQDVRTLQDALANGLGNAAVWLAT